MNKYETPTMDILLFGQEDVIATSGIDMGGDELD